MSIPYEGPRIVPLYTEDAATVAPASDAATFCPVLLNANTSTKFIAVVAAVLPMTSL